MKELDMVVYREFTTLRGSVGYMHGIAHISYTHRETVRVSLSNLTLQELETLKRDRQYQIPHLGAMQTQWAPQHPPSNDFTYRPLGIRTAH